MWRKRGNRSNRKTELAPTETAVGSVDQSLQMKSLIHRLTWTVLRPIATRYGGNEPSRLRGAGIEFAEIREYQPGDDVRQIDWKITARTGVTHVRESYSERGLDVWLLLDLSPSIHWGTAKTSKLERAKEFVTAASLLLGKQGNRIGAVLFANQVLKVLPPAGGKSHLQNLLHNINTTAYQARQGETDFLSALNRLQVSAKRKALVLIVSDFLVANNWQTKLGTLAQRHEVVAVRLRDPREDELPDIGIITLEDPETGQQMVINTHDHKLRERFKSATQHQQETLKQELSTCGVAQLNLTTDEDLLPALVRFLNSRRHRRVSG
jgi:uncharacterized protein (DUF58 family)